MRRKRRVRDEEFNWQKLHERMERLSVTLSAKLDAAGLDAILTERAGQLANAVINDQFEECFDVLTFALLDEQYAIDTAFVSEVIPLKLVTRVPGAPDFFLGVVGRRGEIVAVVDLAKFMHLSVNAPCEHLIFVEAQGLCIGFGVNELKEITTLPRSAFQSLPAQLSSEQIKYLSGVTKSGIGLLNIEELLANERLNFDLV